MKPDAVDHHREASRVNESLAICGDGMSGSMYYCEKLEEYVILEKASDCDCS